MEATAPGFCKSNRILGLERQQDGSTLERENYVNSPTSAPEAGLSQAGFVSVREVVRVRERERDRETERILTANEDTYRNMILFLGAHDRDGARPNLRVSCPPLRVS